MAADPGTNYKVSWPKNIAVYVVHVEPLPDCHSKSELKNEDFSKESYEMNLGDCNG